MPVWKATAQPRTIVRFDVCAKYTETPGVLGHALLCEKNTDWSQDNPSIPSIHMGPPLQKNSRNIDIAGGVVLDDDERKMMEAFVKEQFRERKAKAERLLIDGIDLDYIICPAVQPPTKDHASWRYNCVGFVLAAYDQAGIELVTSEIPEVAMDQLKLAYPSVDQMTHAAKTAMGIGEGTRWPVTFVGYVMASLARSAEAVRENPYSPQLEDIYFSLPADD